MKRSEHTFQFTAVAIHEAAKEEAAFHRGRQSWWLDRQEAAAQLVLDTASVKIVRASQTGGDRIEVAVDPGDVEAYDGILQQAFAKAERHRALAERYETDASIYGSQAPDRAYDLDSDDVHHFRLGGEPRED